VSATDENDTSCEPVKVVSVPENNDIEPPEEMSITLYHRRRHHHDDDDDDDDDDQVSDTITTCGNLIGCE